MDTVTKWLRLTNPQTVEDYSLSVNLDELRQTEEGQEIYEKEILPYLPMGQ